MPGNTASITEWGYRKSKGIPLEKQEGTIRCSHCGRAWNHNQNGNLADAQKKFKRHLRKEHPEVLQNARSIEQIREEIKRERRTAREKKKREEREERVKLISRERQSKVSRRKKASQPRLKLVPQIRRPELTKAMIQEAQLAYRKMGSVKKVAGKYYVEWGYGSAKTLERALYSAGQGGLIRIRSRAEVSREVAKKANLARLKMTPKRLEVARILYFAGYTLRGIGELTAGPWGYSSSSCGAVVGGHLRKIYKLRPATKRKNPISIEREEALKLIKSVA